MDVAATVAINAAAAAVIVTVAAAATATATALFICNLVFFQCNICEHHLITPHPFVQRVRVI